MNSKLLATFLYVTNLDFDCIYNLVDYTTDEIIGGSGWSALDNEKIIKEDPYNFAINS